MRPCVRRHLGITIAYCSHIFLFIFLLFLVSFFLLLSSSRIERAIPTFFSHSFHHFHIHVCHHVRTYIYVLRCTIYRLCLCVRYIFTFLTRSEYDRLNESYAIILNRSRSRLLHSNFSEFSVLKNERKRKIKQNVCSP